MEGGREASKWKSKPTPGEEAAYSLRFISVQYNTINFILYTSIAGWLYPQIFGKNIVKLQFHVDTILVAHLLIKLSYLI